MKARLSAAALAAAVAQLLAGCAASTGPSAQDPAPDPKLAKIGQIVVVYMENRSFDHLFGLYPGANGLAQARAEGRTVQTDRDGKPYAQLPVPLADKNGKPDARLLDPIPNGPFALEPRVALNQPMFSPIHAYYANQRQINGGRNDRFVAEGNSGGLLMGYYDGSQMGLWKLAQRFTLADNFFQSAFGGSFLNHFWLVCACTPVFPDAPATIKAVDEAGNVPGSHEEAYVTTDGHAVNTMQGSWLYDPTKKQALLPPQSLPTIGDRLSDKGIAWAYYAQDYQRAVAATAAGKGLSSFSYHHQPFTFFKRFIDSPAQRATHLKDREDFIADARAGRLPPVSFYKPTGGKNMHPGRGNVADGDAEAVAIVQEVMNGPQWKNTVVIVTTDENGGFWDHAAPPKGDRWGPGSRIPALVVSPFSEGGHVDHTPYETVSILRLIEERFGLKPLSNRDAKATSLARALKL
ncbi:acid phosphatase [Paucibacter sediminis]|uniref:Acid phosphatase n=1 Tax=Paucibacter sediminis TaxID=3019553 RepID=A0AA95SS79_9BURK|nr:acid phosphatase [Paucibacter sp. S2-9]WIT14166.1 acid phosphatase [Paucibacter sp. S2-9]